MVLFQHSVAYCLKEAIGSRGITQDAITAFYPAITQTITALQNKKLPLLNIASVREDIERMEDVVADYKARFTDIVILGTGGSTLNPQALGGLHCYEAHSPQLHFLDNIDPLTMDVVLGKLDLASTGFIAISKSGGTLETLSQALIVVEALKNKGLTPGKHCTVITDPSSSLLRTLGEAIGATILDHEPGIGGRYSSMTNVGLLPAMFAGVDPVKAREGAATVVADLYDRKAQSAAAEYAIVDYLLLENGFPIHVMMPYVDRLDGFTTWYRQTWAESLGKDGVNTTIIKAAGTLDQHSQLQLYLGGARDKQFTVISLNTHSKGAPVPLGVLAQENGLDYLKGKTLGDVMEAEHRATTETLVHNQCPVKTLRLETLDEKVLGALLMHGMLEIILLADLLKINAFDQPAVEESKVRARALLGKLEKAA
jgi:glucose-6-phosphate isomerase